MNLNLSVFWTLVVLGAGVVGSNAAGLALRAERERRGGTGQVLDADEDAGGERHAGRAGRLQGRQPHGRQPAARQRMWTVWKVPAGTVTDSVLETICRVAPFSIRLSTWPAIGIRASQSQRSRVSRRSPAPSAPSAIGSAISQVIAERDRKHRFA